jgi:hypothetical protein
MSRAKRDIEKLQVELAKTRRLLGIAVERLGGEMKFTENEFRAHREVGIDTTNYPFVVTSFIVQPKAVIPSSGGAAAQKLVDDDAG